MKRSILLRISLIALITNVLVSCTNAAGVDIPTGDWWGNLFFGKDGESGNFSTILSTAAAIIGGPYGWAAGIIATAIPAYVKSRKKNHGLTGIVKSIQAGRATLSEENRKIFDDTARDVMNEIKKGDPRQLVRNVKEKLKIATLKAGGKPIPSLSAKHK